MVVRQGDPEMPARTLSASRDDGSGLFEIVIKDTFAFRGSGSGSDAEMPAATSE